MTTLRRCIGSSYPLELTTPDVVREAHELAFAYVGGVFRKLPYDNLTSSVKKILRGDLRTDKARKELGYSPRVTRKEGIAESLPAGRAAPR